MKLRTCVHPEGRFLVGVHRPQYRVENLRKEHREPFLGTTTDGMPVTGSANFPAGPVSVDAADWVYEIANPFHFRGATYISRHHADRAAAEPGIIRIPPRPAVSLSNWLKNLESPDTRTPQSREALISGLPEPLKLALAVTSSDPADLTCLADACCEFVRDPATGRPTGLYFDRDEGGRLHPRIRSERLFELIGNSPHLPKDYQRAMVLRPGVQGESEIVGDVRDGGGRTHIYEYLRANSYIPWGHFAANMADDAVRYHAADLSLADMQGMRRLYYRRTFLRMAAALGVMPPGGDQPLTPEALESIRRAALAAVSGGQSHETPAFTATLWGWNYGFDYAPTGYRLHASHQQIHQQYALITGGVESVDGQPLSTFACGDLVAETVARYRDETGVDFFEAYLKAVRGNRRTDGNPDGPGSLVVFEDARVVLFVPKAQTSQWELHLVPKDRVGNVLEADADMRASLDRALWVAIRVLAGLGAKLVTTIEFSKRFDAGATGQRLLYSLLPRLPYSPGAFSEAQLRWINRHYPEDFAALCRRELTDRRIV